MAVVADSAATGVVIAAPTPGEVPGTPPPGSIADAEALWRTVLCDRLGNPLADISTIGYDLRLRRGLNQPATAQIKVPSWHAYASTIHTDGDPYCEVGVRQLKVYRRDDPSSAWVIVFNGIVWHLEDEGDEDETWTVVTAYDPMIWWRYRPARAYDYDRCTKDLTYNGNFVTMKFAKPQQGISAPEILRMVLDFSQTGDPEDNLGEGPMGISVFGGTVAEYGPNVNPDLSDTPYTIADLHMLLVSTSKLDAWIAPVDNVGDDVMGNLMAVPRAGSDKPWLHLQYGTGNYSVMDLKRSRDMDTIGNKIYYYLGPKLDEEHWQGSITKQGMPDGDPTTPGGTDLPDDPPGFKATVEARVDNSRLKYGVFMDVRIYDANKNEYEFRDAYAHLWQTESYLRAEPREMLFVTPTRNGPYDLFDLELGDTLRVSAFDGIRRGFTAAVQRVYAFTVTVDEDMVEHIHDLETSPNWE
jgi:hypothetical protein